VIERSIVAGIVWSGDGERILIARRHLEDEHGGLWEFPGGRVEEGERLEEALTRELKEELGITVEVLAPLVRIKHTYPESRIALHAFHCRHISGNPSAIDCADWAWVSISELLSYRFSPPDSRVIPLIKPLERDLQGKTEADHPPERINLDQKDRGI